MNCPTCATPLKPGARFCGNCGAVLAEGIPTAAPAISTTTRVSAATPRAIPVKAIAIGVIGLGVALAVVLGVVTAVTAPNGQDTAGDVIADGSDDNTGDAGGDGDGDGSGSGDGSAAGTLLPVSASVDPTFYEVAAWADGVWFISPSGNLSCGIRSTDGVVDFWGCAIAEREWIFPSSSPSDFCYQSEVTCGDGIAVRPGGGSTLPVPLQRGGAEFPNEGGLTTQTLPYGTSLTYGTVTCASTVDNVVCVDTSTAHGFVISRNENEIF